MQRIQSLQLVLLGASLLPTTLQAAPQQSVRSAQPSQREVRSQRESRQTPLRSTGSHSLASHCTVIDFEGLPNLEPVGIVTGPVDVTFAPNWLALVDFDAGGGGNFANEPSPDTVVIYEPGEAPIDFSADVAYVEITYSAASFAIPVIMTAFDGPNGTGSVVGTALGTTVGNSSDGAPCTGDPDGTFCLWDTISIADPASSIRSITIQSVFNGFLFDNLVFCSDGIGTAFCSSLPNSTGQVGRLLASGSEVVADNDLVLTAVDLPQNQTGYVLNSMNSGMTPVGEGILCLGSGKGRHTTQIGNSGTDGVIVTPIDLTALPRSSSPPASAMAGETWYFQLWHRDGMASNLTDGVALTFL